MNSDKTVTAVFEQDSPQYTLTVNVVGEGSVNVNPDSDTYGAGTVVTLTATPASGYRVASWSGADNDPFAGSQGSSSSWNRHDLSDSYR